MKKEEIENLVSDLEIMTDDRDNYKALCKQEQVLRDRTIEMAIKLKEDKEELVKALSIILIWNNENIEFHNINDNALNDLHEILKKHQS